MEREKIRNLARLIVEDCLSIKEGDKILVLTDDGVKNVNDLPELLDDMVDIMNEKNLEPCVMSYKARTKKGAEIPPMVEAACMQSDVLLCGTTYSFLHSGAFPRIYQGGTTTRRLMLLPSGVNVGKTDFFDRMMPDSEEEILGLAAQTKKYGKILCNGEEHDIHLTAQNGTDLTFRIGQLWKGSSVHCGICEPGTLELMPAGTVALGIDEGTAEGTLVIDYSTALKKTPLTGKICFEVHNGYATSITGSSEADDFVKAAEAIPNPPEEKFNIAEFGLGFNGRAKADEHVTDGEHIVGAAHIGIGSNITFGGNIFMPAWHVDCILPNATVEADGKLICENGHYLI